MRIRKRRASPASLDYDRPLKAYLSIPEILSSTDCAIPAARCVSRSAGHFPSSAIVKGRRHFRFSPLRVAACCRYCSHGKGHPAPSPRVSFSCPCLYSLIMSRLRARGRFKLSSGLVGHMSLPSGGRSEGDPVLASPLNCSSPLPLSAFIHAWRDLPGVSPWVLRTIQFGYTLQFACNPPCFNGVSSYCSEQRR